MSFQNILWFGKSAVMGGLKMEDVNFITMPHYLKDDVYSRSYGTQGYVMPNARKLLDLVNNELSPFKEVFTLSDLDIMSVNADGSLSSSTGYVEDKKAALPPPSPEPEEEEPLVDENGNPIDPETGLPIDPETGEPLAVDPETGEPLEGGQLGTASGSGEGSGGTGTTDTSGGTTSQPGGTAPSSPPDTSTAQPPANPDIQAPPDTDPAPVDPAPETPPEPSPVPEVPAAPQIPAEDPGFSLIGPDPAA